MKSENKPIRLAYIVPTFNRGGLERCITRLCNRLDRDRFEPLIISFSNIGTAADWLVGPATECIGMGFGQGNSLRLVSELRQLLRDHRIDIAHSHNWGSLVETGLACSLNRRIRRVHSERGTVLNALGAKAWKVQLRARVASFFLRRCDALLAVADFTKARMLEHFPSVSHNAIVVGNGVDAVCTDGRTEIRESLGLSEDHFLFGSVSRLVPVKDLSTLVSAFSKLYPRAPKCRLVLVGGGPELESLQRKAKEWGVAESVFFAGDQADPGPWLGAMDSYVNCSISEGISQALLEAMSAGLPALVTDVGDHRSIIIRSPQSGFAVDAGDAESLAKSMEKLASDPQLADSFRQASYSKYMTHHTTNVVVERHSEIYDDVMKRSKTGLDSATI